MNTSSERNENFSRGIGATSGSLEGVGTASKGPAGGPIDQWRSDDTAAGTDRLQRLIDYSVVDRDNNKVGSVDAVWSDHTGEPAYVGIKTGWLGLGKAHVVPSDALQVCEATRKIRLPYPVDVVKDAPAFDASDEINDECESQIRAYYAQHGMSGTPTTANTRSTPTDTGVDQPMERGKRSTEDEVRMPLAKEELKVGKREVEYGGVRLKKIIRTETVSQPVELQREEIVVERVPASDRTPARPDVAFREEEVYVPLRREEAVVEKTVRTDEEVRVGKRRETERRDINETVRKEDVDVQSKGTPRKSGPKS